MRLRQIGNIVSVIQQTPKDLHPLSYPSSVHRQAFSTLNQDIMNSYAYATRMRPRQIGNIVSVIQQTTRDLHPLSQTAHLSAHQPWLRSPNLPENKPRTRIQSSHQEVFTHRCQQPDFIAPPIRSVVLTYTLLVHTCATSPLSSSARELSTMIRVIVTGITRPVPDTPVPPFMFVLTSFLYLRTFACTHLMLITHFTVLLQQIYNVALASVGVDP
jgi:hypothetical protein